MARRVREHWGWPLTAPLGEEGLRGTQLGPRGALRRRCQPWARLQAGNAEGSRLGPWLVPHSLQPGSAQSLSSGCQVLRWRPNGLCPVYPEGGDPAVSGPHRSEEALGGTHPERKGRKAGGGLGSMNTHNQSRPSGDSLMSPPCLCDDRVLEGAGNRPGLALGVPTPPTHMGPVSPNSRAPPGPRMGGQQGPLCYIFPCSSAPWLLPSGDPDTPDWSGATGPE